MLSLGFPPIASLNARILVLGTLPSRLSLERAEYYANPRNAFWRIMAAGCSDLPEDYAQRVACLMERRVALWDVLAAATRTGSLDSDISDDAISNHFRAFFHAHPSIRLLCFNGSTASELYRRYVSSTLLVSQRGIEQIVLPSTSCAHARLTFAERVEKWSVVWVPEVIRESSRTVQR